jgi:hypothetical protein
MVERYLPGVTAGQLDEASTRLATAARELAADGLGVRYLGSTFVPEEESCFSRFESADPEGVRRAFERAGITFARIVETRDLIPTKEGT